MGVEESCYGDVRHIVHYVCILHVLCNGSTHRHLLVRHLCCGTTDRETLRRGYTLWTEVAPVVVEYRYTEFRHNHNLDNMPWPIGTAKPIGSSSAPPSTAEKEASQSADWARLHAKHADNVVSCFRRMLGSYVKVLSLSVSLSSSSSSLFALY